MAVKFKRVSKKEFEILKKQGYISKGKDGVVRGLFRTPRGTASIPVKIKGRRK